MNLRAAILSLLVVAGVFLALVLRLALLGLFGAAVLTAVGAALAIGWMVKLGAVAANGGFLDAVDLSLVNKEWVVIPRESGEHLHAAIYRAKADGDERDVAKPYVILTHGTNDRIEHLEWVSVPLALNGFHVLAFNQSGAGRPPHRSPGRSHVYPETTMNIHDVVPFVLAQPDLAPPEDDGRPRVGFVGHSGGGIMAHSQAYLRPEIKVTIALSGVHDFMALVNRDVPRFSPLWWFRTILRLRRRPLDYTPEENRLISPAHCLDAAPGNDRRVFLIHTLDDTLPVDEARKNQQAAGIPDRNCLYLGAGGHAFRSQEPLVTAQVLAWFQTYL